MRLLINLALVLAVTTTTAKAEILYTAKNQRNGITVLTDETCPVNKRLKLAYATGSEDKTLTKACWSFDGDRVMFLLLPEQEIRQMDRKLFHRINFI